MAEAYRGLTIRIGADTTKLRSAMTNLKSAANSLQRDFRKMSNALRIDPHNTDLARARIRTLGNATGAAAAEAARLNRALREAGYSSGLEKANASVEELARNTRNAQVQAAHAEDSYNLINKRLESLYLSMAKLRAGENATEKELKEELERVRSLAHGYNTLSEAKKRNFEASLRAVALENPLNLTGRDATTGNAYVAAFRRLREEWRKTYSELEKANEVVGLQNIANDALMAESRIKQLSAEFTKLRQEEIRIGTGKVKELASEFDRVSVHAREAQSRIDRMDEALRLDPHNVDAASQKMLAFKERSEATARQLVVLRQRMSEMKSQGLDKAIAEARKLDKSVEQIGSEFTEANAKVDVFSAQLEEARLEVERIVREGRIFDLKKATAEVNRLQIELNKAEREAKQTRHEFEIINEAHAGRELASEIALAESRQASYNRELRETIRLNKANLGASIKNLGYAGMSTLTPAVMMAGMYVVQGANDIDAAYRNMRKTVQGTETDFENLMQAAQEFASHGIVSTDQILEIQAMGGQLGIAVDELAEFSEAVSNITIATTITDAQEAAEQLGQMANIMTDMREGLEAGRDVYGQYADMIVRLGNNSATTEDKITAVLQRIAASGNLFGFTTPQLAALATAVASSGQGAEAAGTAIARSFSQIETACANGGEKLEAFAQVAGMSAEEFAQAWDEDAMGTYTAFIEGLKKIDEEGGSVDQTLQNLGITSVREKQTLESLVNMTDVMNDSLVMSQDAWNGVSDEFGQAGDAAREAQRKAEGFSGQLAILKNNGQILASELGEGITPVLKVLNNIVQNLTATFSAMPTGMKTAIIVLGGLAAAAGPLAVMFGVATTSFSNMANQIGLFGDAWTKEAEKEKKAQKQLKKTSGLVNQYGQQMEYVEKTTTNAGNAASNVATKFSKLGKAMKSMAASTAVTLAIMAAVAAVGALVTEIQKAKQEQEDFEKATKGLNDATKQLGSWAGRAAGHIAGFGDASSVAAMDVDELTESLADHAERIGQINKDTQVSIGQMEQWRSVLFHAMDDPDWGQEHIGEVEFAVRQINDATGSTLDAQRLVSGEYENQRALIERITEAEIQRMEQEAAMQVLLEAQQAQGEAYLTMLAEQREYDEAVEQYRRDHNNTIMSEEEIRNHSDAVANAYDEATDAADEYAAACVSVNDAQNYANDTLSKGGSTVSELAEKLQETDFDIFEGSDADVLAEMGTSYDELAESMERLGLSVADLNELGPEGVAELIGILTGENGEANAAAWLNDMGYALDDVAEGTERVATVAAQIDGKDYVFEVSDDGTATEMYGRCEALQAIQIDGKWYVIDDNGTAYDALGKVNEVEQARINDKLFGVNADTSSAWSKINALANSHVSATVDVTPRIQSLKNAIDNFFGTHSWSANVKANIKAVGHAAGGLIPAHAAGGFNGIVTKPLFTNQGLVGEAGAEAVMRWAGGTAIVPLQNRQYVRPFAQTVAQEMPGAFGMYRGATAGEIAAALAQLDLQVRMDSGELVGVLVSNSQRRAAMNVG